MVRNECVRFGGHVGIEVSYKILQLEILKESPILTTRANLRQFCPRIHLDLEGLNPNWQERKECFTNMAEGEKKFNTRKLVEYKGSFILQLLAERTKDSNNLIGGEKKIIL
jgi:hypothetical protein